MGTDSHTLCFLGDVPIGCALVAYNYKLYGTHRKPALLLAAAVSFFGVLHGFAHMSIHMFPDIVKPPETVLGSFGHYLGGFVFLFIGPYAATCFGMPATICLALHAVLSYMFVIIPVQFAFGAVQLVLNFWLCVPRLLMIGCSTEEDIAKRVDDGWPAVSILEFALMPVVFAEMLGCDSFSQAALGHFIYDMSTILATAMYSATIWRQLPIKGE